MLFDCPQCGQTLKAADGTGGKKCRCTNCGQLVTIPGGPPAGQSKPETYRPGQRPGSQPTSTPPSEAKKTPVRQPASVASELNDMIVRQHEQILNEAAAAHQQQARAQRRAEEHGRLRQQYAPNKSSSGSNIGGYVGAAAAVLAILIVVCCGVLGVYVIGGSKELKAGGYSAIAPCQGKVLSRSIGNASGQGIVNRMTGSEFWLYVTSLPNTDPEIVQAVIDGFGSRSASQEKVQRGSLSGTRFHKVISETVSAKGEVQAELEIFVVGNNILSALYTPGSSKHKSGMQRKSAFQSSEEYWDQPDYFFESLKLDAK
jgi:hypothetical protein